MTDYVHPFTRIARLVKEEKTEVSAVYFYAILSGLIQLSLPLGIQAILGFVMGGALSASLVVLITLVVVGILSNGLLQMNQLKVIERIQQKLFVRYSFGFAEKLPRLDLQKTDGYYLPEMVNRFFEIPVLQKSISKILLDFPIAAMQILLGLILLAFYHPAFILFGFLLLLILALMFYITGDKGFKTSLEKSNNKYAVAGWLEEMARVIRSFKFSSSSPLYMEKADSKVLLYLQARKRHFSILLLQYKVLIAFKVIITAAMLIVGCLLLLNQQINIGQFVAAEIIIITVINSVEKLIVNLDSVYSVMTSVEKISSVTDKPTEKSGKYLLGAKEGLEITVRNLSFSYTGQPPVINQLSFTINKNERIGITGKDGTGKSTLLRLLSGAYKDFNGSILINGLPLGNYDLSSLRNETGLLLNQQDVFQGTLWENLTMGNDGIDKDYVLSLCEKVGLSNYISSLREGVDTDLDPTGSRLARNHVQKILLVRALANKPKLLLLEEPWQGIEEPTTRKIQELLLHLPLTTVVVATNDGSFIKNCDQLITLQQPSATN